jgi:Tfp pilus assembly protein PilN
MRAVNLLPEDARGDRGAAALLTTTSVAAVGAALFAAVLIIVGVSFVQAHGKVSDRQETLDSLTQEVTALQAQRAASASSQTTDQARVAAFTAAASGRMAWDGLLDDLSRVLPAGSWLTSLNMQGGVPVTTASGVPTPVVGATLPTAFTVSGLAFSHDVVVRVMQRLSRVPVLSDVTLQSSARTQVGTRSAYQFTMSANIRPPGGDR